MDWLPILLFIHVTSAAIFVGGTVVVAALTARAARATEAEVLSLLGTAEFLGKAVLGPASVGTFLGGIAAMGAERLEPASWLVYGFVGIVVAGAFGGLVLRRFAQRARREPGSEDARRALVLGWAFYALLLVSIVAAMVFKPTL